MEKLAKAGFTQLKQMFADSDDHDHVVKWAADSIKPNDMQSWYLRNYKQNPAIHTTENQEKIAHFSGMHGLSEDIKNVKLDKNDTLESGLAKYDQAEKKWQSSSGSRFTAPEGKKIVELGNGMGWYDLKKPVSSEEANCMGHCGNSGNPHEKDQIFSLRKEVKVGNKTYHEPMSTAIYNKGWLGEMKGRANSRPGEKFHEHYAALLKHPKIKGLIGAGHKPQENFHFDDLSPELQQQVKTANPAMVDLRSNAWDTATKYKATASVPKIKKYQHTVKDIHRSTELKDQLDQGHPMDALKSSDLRLVVDHPAFQKGHLDKLVKGIANQKGIKDVYSKLQAYGAIERSPHLNDQHIDHLIDSDEIANTAQLLRKKLNQSHVDSIVQKAPVMAAKQLKDHRLLNQSHVDHIVQKAPGMAAEYLNDHPLFNASHIDHIAQKYPSKAAGYLNDHPLFNQSHLDHIVQEYPNAAEYLKDHPLFNQSHVDSIVQTDPGMAAEQLKDHRLFNQSHIDRIAQESPYSAAEQLKDHPLLNQSHIDHIVQENPRVAAQYLNKHLLLNQSHIDHIVQQDPRLAASRLKDHPLFNQSHITHIVQQEPSEAAEQLKDHPLLNQSHIDHIVQENPRVAAQYLNKHLLLNQSHIDHIVQKEPSKAAYRLKDHPLFNASHVDHIVQNVPYSAVEALQNHPLLNQSHIDHLVQQVPHIAAEYLKDHPLFAEAVRRAEAKKVQKSEATAPLTKSEKNLKSVVQKLKRKATPQKPWNPESYGYDDGSDDVYNDIDDAVDHHNLSANRRMERYQEINPEHTEKMMDPSELIPSAHLPQTSGWLKQHPEQEWINRLKEQFPDRDFAHTLDKKNKKALSPAITINGELADGYGRAHLAHALGEHLPTYDYKRKLQKSIVGVPQMKKSNDLAQDLKKQGAKDPKAILQTQKEKEDLKKGDVVTLGAKIKAKIKAKKESSSTEASTVKRLSPEEQLANRKKHQAEANSSAMTDVSSHRRGAYAPQNSAAERLKERAETVKKLKDQSDHKDRLVHMMGEQHGPVGASAASHVFEANADRYSLSLNRDDTREKERVAGKAKTYITHYGQTPEGHHVFLHQNAGLARLMAVPSDGSAVKHLGSIHRATDAVRVPNPKYYTSAEAAQADQADSLERYKQSHQDPKGNALREKELRSTKLLSDAIPSMAKYKDAGEFNKKDYTISRGPHSWGFEIRKKGNDRESFRYHVQKGVPKDHAEHNSLDAQPLVITPAYTKDEENHGQAMRFFQQHMQGHFKVKSAYGDFSLQPEQNPSWTPQPEAVPPRGEKVPSMFGKKTEQPKKPNPFSVVKSQRLAKGDVINLGAKIKAKIKEKKESVKPGSPEARQATIEKYGPSMADLYGAFDKHKAKIEKKKAPVSRDAQIEQAFNQQNGTPDLVDTPRPPMPLHTPQETDARHLHDVLVNEYDYDSKIHRPSDGYEDGDLVEDYAAIHLGSTPQHRSEQGIHRQIPFAQWKELHESPVHEQGSDAKDAQAPMVERLASDAIETAGSQGFSRIFLHPDYNSKDFAAFKFKQAADKAPKPDLSPEAQTARKNLLSSIASKLKKKPDGPT